MRLLTKVVPLLAFFLLCNIDSFAQFTAKMTSSGIGYLEYLPPDYATNTSRTYPLMIFLHGAGEKGNGTASSMERIKNLGPPKEIKNGHDMCFMVNGNEECFIVISPQLRSSANSWYGSYIDQVVQHAINNYRVDVTQIHMTGLSLGGNGTYNFAYDNRNNPNILASMSVIAGWGNQSKGCIIAERQIPLWAFHGDLDTTVPYNNGLGSFNSVQDCTTPVPTQELIFTTYAGVRHNSWGRAYKTDNSLHDPNIYEWMLSKSLGGPPSVNAGNDKSLTLPTNSTTLNGSASDSDGTVTSYAWTKISGPAATLDNATTPNLSLSNLVEGSYTFRLTATDNDGNTAFDEANVVVNPAAVNQPPTSNAGSDQSLTLPVNSTNLNGSGSDSDGTVTSYAWNQQNGPGSATITGGNSATASVSNLVEGSYTFRLTVTDNDGATAFDDVVVTVNPAAVNQPPTANAGPNVNLVLPTNSTNLVGSGNDPDGTITNYLWEKISGPNANISNPTLSTASISNLVEGNYTFRLTVTDNDGATANDQVNVTVQAANVPPTVDAGSNKNITLPTNTVVMNGSAGDTDGTITSYTWSQVSGPSAATLANQNTASLTASSLQQGTYTFRLTVEDNDGASALDEATVTVNAAPVNNPPVADAGPDQSITLPTNSVTLNGSGTDSDGTVASYSWIKASGPAANLGGASTPNLNAFNLVAGTYVFRLTVTDNDGDTDQDIATVVVAPETVNQNPTVNAGPDQTITLPKDNGTLISSANDPDGSIAGRLWQQLSGPNSATLTDPTAPTLGLSNLIEGTYHFEITVTDNQGATGSDDVFVFVNPANLPPVVNAGPNITLTLPTNFTDITATVSDADGSVSTLLWTQRSGAPTTMLNDDMLTLTVQDMAEGTYVFRLIAVDNDGDSGFDDVIVTVLAPTPNELPTAFAGADQTVTLPTNTLVLNGSGSDTDGTITDYQWSKESGPNVNLSNATTNTVTLNNLVEGVYVFRLTVTDNDGGSAFDEVTVTVNPATVNQLPVANAGSNVTITLPVNSVTLNGSGTDADGSIVSYQWLKLSGPTTNLSNENTANLTANNLLEGTYTFRLTVTDNDGGSDSDDVTVSVQPAVVNQSPVANAGNDINLVLPTNSTNIFGSGSDPDGTIVSYQWSKISGPASNLSGQTNPVLSASGLVEGVYVFRLTVTDDDGATDDDDVTVTVSSPAVNQPPVADAGGNINISLPTNSVTISGSGTDPDGTVVAYDWVKISGGNADLTNADQPTLQVDNLGEGTYSFRLTVTDDDGASANDLMQVIVQAAAVNNAPVANAGGNQTLVLPNNSTVLNGSGSDSDGSVVTYLWSQESGPASTMMNLDQLDLSVSDLTEGVHVFRLTVTDDDGAIGSDEATIDVQPAATNIVPIADAGGNQSLNLPTNTITLNGNGTDADGTITGFLWEKVSGPTLSFDDPTLASVTLSSLVEGVYEIRLTVTDNDGATDDDQITLSVLPESVNQSPSANAGPDVLVDFPGDAATLVGDGTDPDGTISSFLWTKESGPAEGIINGETTPTLSLSDLSEGTYSFRLTVTDDGGLSAFDDVEVVVLPGSDPDNDAPVANAGNDQQIIFPENSTFLIGAFEDDGFVDNFRWEQISGGQATLIDQDSLTLGLQDLELGTYVFELTVTDFDGLSDSDQVQVQVIEDGDIVLADAMKAFSPNNDGFNDFWILDEDVNKISGCQLIIFDRNGIKIFEANPYLNDWDGTDSSGNIKEGVFYYVLRCENGDDNTDTGSITVVR